jgi:hypothetical protein
MDGMQELPRKRTACMIRWIILAAVLLSTSSCSMTGPLDVARWISDRVEADFHASGN